jgi:LacI family transcriptional regulator
VVSYVVNEGPRRVAPETAARVRAAIDALSYRPNVNARALRKGSTEMVGMIVPDIGNPFFAELAKAVEVAAAARGYLLIVANSDADEETERRIANEMAGRHVDGLLLSTVLAPADLRVLTHPRRPIVLLNVSGTFPGYYGIGATARDGAYALVDHLIAVHGHTSVTLIIGESSEKVPGPREVGWGDALRTHGLPPGPVVRTDFSRYGGYRAGLEMLGWSTTPAAVFVSSDQQCVGVLRAIREAGLGCPDDVALVSFDGTEESEFSWPALTVSRQPVQEMAEAALSMVLDPGSVRLDYQQFPTELVIRRSCGCRNTS